MNDAKDSFETVLALTPTDYTCKTQGTTLASEIQYDTNAILIPDDERFVSAMGMKRTQATEAKIKGREKGIEIYEVNPINNKKQIYNGVKELKHKD